eukprot:scaffold190630_cov31-Tisochrysis_lutea.AAC.2
MPALFPIPLPALRCVPRALLRGSENGVLHSVASGVSQRPVGLVPSFLLRYQAAAPPRSALCIWERFAPIARAPFSVVVKIGALRSEILMILYVFFSFFSLGSLFAYARSSVRLRGSSPRLQLARLTRVVGGIFSAFAFLSRTINKFLSSAGAAIGWSWAWCAVTPPTRNVGVAYSSREAHGASPVGENATQNDYERATER